MQAEDGKAKRTTRDGVVEMDAVIGSATGAMRGRGCGMKMDSARAEDARGRERIGEV